MPMVVRTMTVKQCGYVLVLAMQLLMKECFGQGRMLEPPGRSSMWRFGYDTPVNHNDNAVNCGGLKRQWGLNNGACGICGDPWDAKLPRDHEDGGVYARDILSAGYTSGSVMNVITEVTNVNGGYFEFRICYSGDFKYPAKQSCLNSSALTIFKSGQSRYADIVEGVNEMHVQLPAGLVCDRCILQWKYTTADNWGCENTDHGGERCCFGCGDIQATYYACADIAIYSNMPSVKDLENTDHLNLTHVKRRSKRQTNIFPGRYHQVSNAVDRFGPGLIAIPNAHNGRWSWTGNARDIMNTRSGNIQTFPQGRFTARMHSTGTINTGGQRQIVTIAAPVRSMVRVNQPIAEPLFGLTSGGIPLRSGLYQQVNSVHAQPLFMNPSVSQAFQRHMMTKRPPSSNTCKSVGPFRTRAMDRWCDSNCMQGNCVVNECMCPGRAHRDCTKCPYGLCLDDMLELQKLFPGLFSDPVTFLDCQQYEEQLYNLKSFKVLSEGMPECKHPRFKRQLGRRPSMHGDDDDVGCCGTRPQVIMPLTVESDNETFHVVQLPNDNSQFLVQGICGHNRTLTCPVCSPEHNFQWILVYDPRLQTSPAVNFVPVRFPHYCRCRNPGRVFG